MLVMRAYDNDSTAIEARAKEIWEESDAFVAPDVPARRPFTMFLVPPNASGPMHIGNALMIALQDPLARYHRMKGDLTLWIPGTDHGGYETQITFEKGLESHGVSRDSISRQDFLEAIEEFVAQNNGVIDSQIRALGASVDWTRRRFTLDDEGKAAIHSVFRRMLTDDLIYRRSYMVNYCPSCATVLADIELKYEQIPATRCLVNVALSDGSGSVMLAVERPESLFTVTHVLVHPQDAKHAHRIGSSLVNPITGEGIAVIASERAYVAEEQREYLEPFMPSSVRYDYEYAIRRNMPAYDVMDWNGRFTVRYPGLTTEEAREKEIAFLREGGMLAEEVPGETTVARCKKGHVASCIIRQTWFMRLDDERISLRKNALSAIERERLTLYPQWRMKGLVEWIGKMHDWPIARQNIWGVRIPLWYEISNPSLLTVWFTDSAGERRVGRLDLLLESGVPFEEIQAGLERVYAEEGCAWTDMPEEGVSYLPETDTFDTWFSSGAWSTTVFGDPGSEPGRSPWYPSDVMVIGHDLLRLSVARKIFLSTYLSGKLPFRFVYLHRLILGSDGQKMSKSTGNVVALEEYLERYGADVTRMALVSYATSQEDFIFVNERLEKYESFAERVLRLARACAVIREHGLPVRAENGNSVSGDIEKLASSVGHSLERVRLTEAQDSVVAYLNTLEIQANEALSHADIEAAARAFHDAFEAYLRVLHPFMPHLTEYIHSGTGSNRPLALSAWPKSQQRVRHDGKGSF